jgi:hypothetical protein
MDIVEVPNNFTVVKLHVGYTNCPYSSRVWAFMSEIPEHSPLSKKLQFNASVTLRENSVFNQP